MDPGFLPLQWSPSIQWGTHAAGSRHAAWFSTAESREGVVSERPCPVNPSRRFLSSGRDLLRIFAACAVIAVGSIHPGPAHSTTPTTVPLSGHVLDAINQSSPDPAATPRDAATLTLTITLKRDDETGFRHYLDEVHDPASATFRKFLKPEAVSDRFGPSRSDYATVRDWFVGRGFSLTAESANRMTLTVTAPVAAIEHALAVTVRGYRLGATEYHANDTDPTLPASIADKVQAISGLSDLARPQPQIAIVEALCRLNSKIIFTADGYTPPTAEQMYQECLTAVRDIAVYFGGGGGMGAGIIDGGANAPGSPPWLAIDGTGQRVGLVEFDAFHTSDVADYLAMVGFPASLIDQLSTVEVNGGTSPGAAEEEVLLDIDTVLSVAPGADVVVYEGSPSTTYQQMFNAMISGGVTIISNSWSSCEDQVTQADAQSIDAILATAAASGITVFNGSGDSGSTCLDGAGGTIGVPADSPHATAVGGTTLSVGDGGTYAGEAWWNGVGSTPQTGQGGFGISRYFARPSYQDGHTASATRSVPDVVINADPATGVMLCQADAGGCPTGLQYGGTSYAAPLWAGLMARINQALGQNSGALNPQVYPLAGSAAFHGASSMGSDFTHVGIGSPNANALVLALSGQSAGPVSTGTSGVYTYLSPAVALTPYFSGVPNDGTTAAGIVVALRDAAGNPVSGKTVQLTASPGSHASISPASATTDAANGTAIFAVTDSVAESFSITATDVTDGITLTSPTPVVFNVAPAAGASIMAFPTTVNADGISTTTITVTLQDAQQRPTPGKVISLAQGSGRSIVSGPNPPVTGANGQISFTATDVNTETVTYTAVDVTDGNLPVPGSAVVTFQNGVGSCVTTTYTAAPGYALTPYVTGFFAQNFFYGNVNFGCAGTGGAAFDTSGSIFATDFPTGQLFRLPPGGGAATSPLSTPGPTIGGPPIFGPDGKLYATHSVTSSGFTSGDVVELDPVTGATVRVLASNLTCPQAPTIDPISGDLFFADACTGAGSDNPSIFRIVDPSGPSPTLVTYATMPTTPTGQISFAPDGTLFVVVGYYNNPHAPIYVVSPTNGPQPPTVTLFPDLTTNYWLRVGRANPDGSAKSLVIMGGDDLITLEEADISAEPYAITPLADGGVGTGPIGPDGCMYVQSAETIYRLAPATGPCEFATTNPSPSVTLSPTGVTPDPQQGGTVAFTATFRNVEVPQGTPVFFRVFGANAQAKLVDTDADGTATFVETGVAAGSDTIFATATVDGVTLTSNTAYITWDAGPHTTYLNLNLSPSTAMAGRPVTLSANLTDVSVSPAVGVPGAMISFSVAGQSCQATTAANGTGSCTLTIPDVGAFTLTASYAGGSGLLPDSISRTFTTTPFSDIIFEDGFDP